MIRRNVNLPTKQTLLICPNQVLKTLPNCFTGLSLEDGFAENFKFVDLLWKQINQRSTVKNGPHHLIEKGSSNRLLNYFCLPRQIFLTSFYRHPNTEPIFDKAYLHKTALQGFKVLVFFKRFSRSFNINLSRNSSHIYSHQNSQTLIQKSWRPGS